MEYALKKTHISVKLAGYRKQWDLDKAKKGTVPKYLSYFETVPLHVLYI